MRNRSTGKLRDELLDWENFYTLTEPKILIAPWRRQYNYGAAIAHLGLSAIGDGSRPTRATEWLDQEPSSLMRTSPITRGRSGSPPGLAVMKPGPGLV